MTLLLDAVKGWLPVVLVQWFGKPYGLQEGTMAMVGLAAFLGHLFPVFFRFEGGKARGHGAGGVARYPLALGLQPCWWGVAMAALFRYSSLASLVAALMAPIIYVLSDGAPVGHEPLCGAVHRGDVGLIWRHAENIGRLLKGTESKPG